MNILELRRAGLDFWEKIVVSFFSPGSSFLYFMSVMRQMFSVDERSDCRQAKLACLFVCLLQSYVVKHVQYAVYCCLVNNILSHRCFHRTWYFGLHLLCLLVVLALPVKSKRRQAKEQQDDLQKDNQTDHNSTDNNCNQKEKTTWGSGRWHAAPSAAETLRRTINYWELECVESVYLTKNQISPIRQKTQVYILAKTSSSKADSNHTSDMDTRPRWRNGQGVN